jgi:hypothetical protein
MALDYSSLLSADQKKSILEQRIAQFASEAYQHDINKKVATASNNEEGVKASEDALAILEGAIAVHQDELAKLPTTAE